MIDFVTKVREMRQAQKDYYQFRCAQTLGLAKSLERQVDAVLEEGVTVWETATLENMNFAPAEGEQLGMFEEPDADEAGRLPRRAEEHRSPRNDGDEELDLSGE